MFNLGFTLEELMFPENYPMNFFSQMETNDFIDKFDDIDCQEQQLAIDDDDDDWFTIKQLSSEILSKDNCMDVINDQMLPLSNVFFDNYQLEQIKSMVDFDGTITGLLSPNLSVKVSRERANILSQSDTILSSSHSPPCEQRLLKTHSTTILPEQTNKHLTLKSTSSLSFRTQSSTSMTNSSIDEISVHSNDFNEASFIHHSTDSLQKFSHHQHSKDQSLKIGHRRRRKRTIFTSADIEYLKEAFLQNPKPSQQDIAILSEQLGHDSYVIRVWFYNKRQATKKRMN